MPINERLFLLQREHMIMILQLMVKSRQYGN